MDEILRNLFQGAGSGQERPARQQRQPRHGLAARTAISLVITLVLGAVYYYFKLPALNVHAGEFYWFVFLLCLVFTVLMTLMSGFRAGRPQEYVHYVRRHLPVPFYLVALMLAACVIGGAAGLVVFRTKAYSSLLPLQTGDFASEVSEISFRQIPMLDSQSANNLTNRKLGELSDLVSQFTVNPESAQINYRNVPVRVTYLNYDNFFKWVANRKKGLPAFMYVDMVTQEVSVVRLEEGMHYSPSEYLNHDLYRHLRFQYPTLIFDDINFEIDEDGTPYWIASVITKTIGLFGGRDAVGAVLMNAVTGESQFCSIDEIPSWVDRVYASDLIIEQYDYYGRYHNGFLNAMFGQENCTVTTDGYNYIALNDDVWVYTGVTSVSSDLGNVGFILVNQRTKQARYYTCAGAEEYSAMSSAEGAVQQFSYQSTFPLLLNIADQPTYFMALKDAAGLVKMYAMVNVQQYQIVTTASSVAACEERYRELLVENGIVSGETGTPQEDQAGSTVEGVLAEIRSATIDGNTWYYLRLEQSEVYYKISAELDERTVILNVGDQVEIRYVPSEGEIQTAAAVERK